MIPVKSYLLCTVMPFTKIAMRYVAPLVKYTFLYIGNSAPNLFEHRNRKCPSLSMKRCFACSGMISSVKKDEFFSYTGPYSSILPFLLRASLSGSGLSDSVVFVLVPTDAGSLLCRECSCCSLGLFQEGRVAIQSTSAPNTVISNPSTFTKLASGGESLYFGSFLCMIVKHNIQL